MLNTMAWNINDLIMTDEIEKQNQKNQYSLCNFIFPMIFTILFHVYHYLKFLLLSRSFSYLLNICRLFI